MSIQSLLPDDAELIDLRTASSVPASTPGPMPTPLHDLLLLARQLGGLPAAAISLELPEGVRLRSLIGAEGDAEPLLDALACGAMDGDVLPADMPDPSAPWTDLTVAGVPVGFCIDLPVIAARGRRVGGLCVMDVAPRTLDVTATDALQALSRLIGGLVDRRRHESDASVSWDAAALPSAWPPDEAHATGSIDLSRIDPINGLRNRNGLVRMRQDPERLRKLMAEPFTLMLLDIDHFQRVNERHGRELGDRALRAVAEAVSSAVRAKDVAVRFGGEEFLVVMPRASAVQTEEIAERIRGRVAEALLPFPLTLSIGVAVGGPQNDPPKAVLERADRALKRAKSTGRNRVVLDTDELLVDASSAS